MGILERMFAGENKRQIKKITAIADKVQALEEEYKTYSDETLKENTKKLKDRLTNGETLDDILPEAFANVREASWRVLGMRHFFVQLMGGVVLHQGRIAEMKTGEGKTLVATLPAYLNALAGNGVHIVTVNDYLANRDAEWMGKIYKFLGLTVGVVISGMSAPAKKAAYNCDITYCTNNELGFDYLRDNMAIRKEYKMQRMLNFAIIDEVDSILIDEARTPLIISGEGEKSSDMYHKADQFAKKLLPGEYIIEEKERTCRLDETGVEKAERYFKVDNLSDIENQDIIHYINNALKANFIMKADKDYIVNDGEVIIVDENTGRLMIGRRYSDGLHQAIEAKEKVQVKGESKTLATITFQNYFRLYKKLSGMTGTAKTEEQEFKDIYRLDVVVLPTNKPNARADENDQLYTTEKGKFEAIVGDIQKSNEKGQPVLVGTVSVEKSEALSKVLTKHRIAHDVLNAKNHKREAEIVAQAGHLGAVTIATNMAGRGTDILLGGNPEFLALQKLQKLGYSDELIAEANSLSHTDNEEIIKVRTEFNNYLEKFKKETDTEKERVIAAGGLRIIGTERHESRRIDNQLRGRAGRQGDVGSTVFYLSMEDDILRIFGGETLQRISSTMRLPDDQPIAMKILTKTIESSQARVEDRNYSARKHTISYDDVMNAQRDIIYKQRNEVLDGADVHEQVLKMMDDVAQEIIGEYVDYEHDYSEWDFDGFNRALEENLLEAGTNLLSEELVRECDVTGIRDAIMESTVYQYEKKIAEAKEIGLDFGEVERVIMLKTVDKKWIEHIDDAQRLKEGIGLRAYGHQDPVLAYRREIGDMFYDMIEEIRRDVVKILCKAKFEKPVERKAAATETNAQGGGSRQEKKKKTVTGEAKREEPKVGRNDPCPCGSGKKYKNCHGA